MQRIGDSKALQRLQAIGERAIARLDSDPEEVARIQAANARVDREAWVLTMREAGVPKRLIELCVERVDPNGLEWKLTDALSQLQRALADGHRLVTMRGPTGTGKSAAAAEVAFERVKAGASPLWTTAKGYCWTVRQSQQYGRDGADARSKLRRLQRCSLLVLDELGMEKERDREEVEELIATRYDAGRDRATILTCNLRWVEIAGGFDKTVQRQVAGMYDKRTVKRLEEMGVPLICRQKVRPNKAEVEGQQRLGLTGEA